MNMISWLPIAIIAYLISAINGTVDRAIVHKEQTQPIVISFWVALFSITTAGIILVGFLPFDFASNFKFVLGSNNIMLLALLVGFLSQLGFMLTYRALKYGEVTRVLSVLGGLTPVVSLISAYVFLNERLGSYTFFAFLILIIATIILTLNPRKLSHKNFSKWVINITLASLVFGSHAVLAKYVYNNYHFISAYSLSGLGSGAYLLVIALLSKNVRREIAGIFKPKIKNSKKATRSKQVYIIFGNSMLGGVAAILTSYAINLGSPTLVGALRGVQYAGIFLIAIILSKFYPKLLAEDLGRKSLVLKTAGIILTISGITILASNL